MKQIIALIFATALFLASSWSPAHSADATGKQSRTLPVLVKVNKKGKVTEVSPAYKLHPAFAHKVRDEVRKLITKPAMRHGKPVSSQLVLTLAVVSTTSHDGARNVSLKYLKSQALPYGNWTWSLNKTTGKLGLTNQIVWDPLTTTGAPMPASGPGGGRAQVVPPTSGRGH